MEDFSRYATIIPAEHIPVLSRDLKKIPDFTWLLGSSHAQIERLQGDLISNFPTVFLDHPATVRSREFTVMILNNTCDLPDERLDFITAAPVVDFNKFLEFERQKRFQKSSPISVAERQRIEDSIQEFARVLRSNDKTKILHLPQFGEFTHGALVLLHYVCSVSSKIYHESLRQGHRLASFTQTGFYFLLITDQTVG